MIPIGIDTGYAYPRYPAIVTSIVGISATVAFIVKSYDKGLVNAFVYTAGSSLSYRVFTTVLIHNNLWHLVVNLLFWLLFAYAVESARGHYVLILVMFASGVASVIVYRYCCSGCYVMGLSGVIAGCVGYATASFPKASIVVIVPVGIPVFFEISLVTFVFVWLLYFLFVMTPASLPGHIAGFLVGGLYGIMTKSRRNGYVVKQV